MPTSMTLEGKVPPLPRKVTGLFSLDYALGNPNTGDYGMPLRALYEIYGRPERGKNTLAFFLAGKIRPIGLIGYNWLETVDPGYIVSAVSMSGFRGRVKMIDHFAPDADPKKDPPRYHEDMLKEGAILLNKQESNAYILDSLGAVRSQQEKDGEYGEAFWGLRAKLVNQHSRDLEGITMDKPGDPCAAFMLNHVQVSMGSRASPGITVWHTPGGEGKEFHASVRVHLKTVNPKETLVPDGIVVTRGVVEKLRFGGKGREFVFAIVPGRGLHPGLTALIDAVEMKLAEKATGGVISIKGATGKKDKKEIGKLSDLVQAAVDKEDEVFEPFIAALRPLYGHDFE